MSNSTSSESRDTAIALLLPHVPFDGWTPAALRRALVSAGHNPAEADWLFPAGPSDMIAAWCAFADRRMVQGALTLPLADMKVPARIRALVALRLHDAGGEKEATRRALGLLALPRHAGLAVRVMARTVDAIWHTAGDRSADFSWYSKRAILGGVYGATLVRWLADESPDLAPTMAFLDRRLADVARIGRLRRRLMPAAG